MAALVTEVKPRQMQVARLRQEEEDSWISSEELHTDGSSDDEFMRWTAASCSGDLASGHTLVSAMGSAAQAATGKHNLLSHHHSSALHKHTHHQHQHHCSKQQDHPRQQSSHTKITATEYSAFSSTATSALTAGASGKEAISSKSSTMCREGCAPPSNTPPSSASEPALQDAPHLTETSRRLSELGMEEGGGRPLLPSSHTLHSNTEDQDSSVEEQEDIILWRPKRGSIKLPHLDLGPSVPSTSASLPEGGPAAEGGPIPEDGPIGSLKTNSTRQEEDKNCPSAILSTDATTTTDLESNTSKMGPQSSGGT